MSQDSMVKVAGLHEGENPYSEVPQGGLVTADNTVFAGRHVIESRRGQYRTGSMPASNVIPMAAHLWMVDGSNYLFSHVPDSSKLARDSGLTGTNSWLATTIDAPDPTTLRMKFCEMARRLFVTAAAGIRVIDSPTADHAAAGVPRALAPLFDWSKAIGDGNGYSGLYNQIINGWMSANTAVGYRVVFGRKDANGVFRWGAPSPRIIITNPPDRVVAAGGMVRATNVVTVTLPLGHGLRKGDLITVSPGETGFPSGSKQVTAATSTTITYAETAADATSADSQTISSGGKDTFIVIPVPTGVLDSDVFRIYRTEMSGAYDEDPGDEFFLAWEQVVGANTYDAGDNLGVADITPESFLGQPLYTNPNTGDGALSAKFPPPIAQDLEVFDGRLWAAETTDYQRLRLRLIGVGATEGLESTDILIQNGVAVLCSSFVPATPDGTPSQNIERVSQAMVTYLNDPNYFDVPSNAHLMTSGDSPVGDIQFEGKLPTTPKFYMATTKPTAFAEAIPMAFSVDTIERATNVVTVVTDAAHGLSAGDEVYLASTNVLGTQVFDLGIKTIVSAPTTTSFTYDDTGADEADAVNDYYVYAPSFTSEADQKPLRYSEASEPEAWPLLNYPVGLPEDRKLLRIKSHRGKLYCFFEHGDIYTVSGRFPYYVERFDATTTLLAPDTLVEHSNRLFGLTTQGVVAISDSGVQIVSSEIDETLNSLVANASAELRRLSFGVSYESDHQYQLWLPIEAGDTVCRQAYVLNTLFGKWSRWTGRRTWGLMNRSTNTLLLGDGRGVVGIKTPGDYEYGFYQERKSRSRSDYADDQLGGFSITAVNGRVLTLAAIAGSGYDLPDISAGDILWVSASKMCLVESVDSAGGTVTLIQELDVGALPATCTFFEAIPVEMKFHPMFGQAPGLEKQWREVILHLGRLVAHELTVSFDSEKSPVEATVLVRDGLFGDEQFGVGLFGNPEMERNKRLTVPARFSRSVGLRVGLTFREAYGMLRLYGFTPTFEVVSERTGA